MTGKIYIHLYNLSLTEVIHRLRREKKKINTQRILGGKNNRSILLLFVPVNVVFQFGSLASSSAVNSPMRGKFQSSYQKWGFWFHLTSKGWNRIWATVYVGACFELLRKMPCLSTLRTKDLICFLTVNVLAHPNLFPTWSSIISYFNANRSRLISHRRG